MFRRPVAIINFIFSVYVKLLHLRYICPGGTSPGTNIYIVCLGDSMYIILVI